MSFLDAMTADLKPGFQMPDALVKLFIWMEENGCVAKYNDGRPYGSLAPIALLNTSEPILDEDGEHVGDRLIGGTSTLFHTGDNQYLHYWFDSKDEAILSRLSVFAKTGGDGSMAAFWLDDEGKQHIVHMGSGSGSTLNCILASDPVDFLRLNAIGYDELCWPEVYDDPPNADWQDEGRFIEPYEPFQTWVRDTFGVTIPGTAREIVTTAPTGAHRAPVGDAFHDWVMSVTEADE